MSLYFEQIFIVVSALLVMSILASKLSSWLGVPVLLIFLGVGMLAGSDGPGKIYFDNPHLTQGLGIMALAMILFSSGLDTRWERVRDLVKPALSLATLGVFLTSVLVGLFVWRFFNFTPTNALLLGAIVSSTDAAAVFSILRSRGVGLKKPIAPLLELEAGGNDPMAVFLTLALIELIQNPEQSWQVLVMLFVKQVVIGLALGYGLGRVMVGLINRLHLDYEGLYPTLTMAGVMLIYGAVSVLGGSGFLAVYLAGLVLGHRDFIHKKSIMRFHDGMAWLMQIVMFLVLGLQVFPSKLPSVAPLGIALSLFLIFVARPLSVFICLAPFKLGFKKLLMISWVGLRGAVPIILATFPILAGVAKADKLFHLVFFVVITSALLQGTTLPFVAKLLKQDSQEEKLLHFPLELDAMTEGVKANLVEFIVPYNGSVVGKKIVQLGMPEETLIALICREGKFVVPSGATEILAGDVLLALVSEAQASEVKGILAV